MKDPGGNDIQNELKPLITLFNSIGEDNVEINIPENPAPELKEVYQAAAALAERVDQKIKKTMKKLTRQLYLDELTDLPNRKKLLSDIQRCKEPILLIIDIDAFKEINDLYGNIYGDYTLIELSHLLESLLPNSKYRLYKMPADQYAILVDPAVHRKEIEEFAHFLCLTIADSPIPFIENDIYVKVTIGISIATDFGEKIIWLDMIKDADMALKRARKDNRSVVIYDESMGISKEYENNLMWAKILRDAVNDDRIVPYFQPIFNNHSGKVEKFECLVRLFKEDGEIVNPINFIGIAKKTRLYSSVTRIMIDKSFEVFKNTDYEFSINLSAIDILDYDTNYYIKSKLQEYPGIANRVVFEILESEGIENYDKVKAFIDEVKAMGCKIAIDDFGTGYSNFEYILKLNVDFIKIDASLTKNLKDDRNSQIITKTIADFSKKLGVKTISEFVHSEAVYLKESELGIDFSQGYYFGEPRDKL